jgi:uncharacterized protein (TIGR02284 family)
MTNYSESLSALHTTLLDSMNGYEEALKDAGKTGLVSVFEEMLALRRQATVELEPLLTQAGVKPDQDGSYMSTVHRTIISVQSMMTDLDESSLPGFIDGEKRILTYYDDALTHAGDPDREVLLRQREQTADRIAEMERRREKAA